MPRTCSGAGALNQIYGCTAPFDSTSAPCTATTVALDHLFKCVASCPPFDDLCKPNAALSELLRSDALYGSERSDLAPFSPALLSVPNVRENVCGAFPLGSSLGPSDAHLIEREGRGLLLSPAALAEHPPVKVKPYMCLTLHKRAAYLEFIKLSVHGGLLKA